MKREQMALVGAAVLFLPAAMAIGAWLFVNRIESRAEDARALDRHTAPLSRVLGPAELRRGSALAVYTLPGELGRVRIYDIVPADDGAWLGSGLGLVRLQSDGSLTLHRIAPSSPREWARNLVRTDEGIAMSLSLAQGNTGGTPLGTYLFRTGSERWERIGDYTRELAWDGRALYGVQERDLLRFRETPEGWRSERVFEHVHVCADVQMSGAEGELWLSQQSQRRIGRTKIREVPCGVTRVASDGTSTRWMAEDGLASGFGRAVVADGSAVYVSHGIQGKGLSVLEAPRRDARWRVQRGSRNRVYLGANFLGLSPGSVWLGTPDGRKPLVRLDRTSGDAEVLRDVPPDHYVSALAGDGRGAWIAWSRKSYANGGLSVRTWVGRAEDPIPAPLSEEARAKRPGS